MSTALPTVLVTALLTVLVVTVTTITALTQEQIDKFTSSDYVETNTGLSGDVTAVVGDDDVLTITTNAIPNHETGEFPAKNINPNEIAEQDLVMKVPNTPNWLETPGCMMMGPVGVMTNGIPMFNVYTITLEDAVVEETFDECQGHPDIQDVYHYHQTPGCIVSGADSPDDLFIGVALDGYPIYGPYDENGLELKSADLDICHGRTGSDGTYRYHTTSDWPYTVGCFRGDIIEQEKLGMDRNKRQEEEIPEGGDLPVENQALCLYACNVEGIDTSSVDTSFCDDEKEMNGAQSTAVGHVIGSVVMAILALLITVG